MRAPGAKPPSVAAQVPPETSLPEQELPPGVVRVSEPSPTGEWQTMDLKAGPPPEPPKAKHKISNVVIAIIVICLLIAGGAATYFLVFWGKGASVSWKKQGDEALSLSDVSALNRSHV